MRVVFILVGCHVSFARRDESSQQTIGRDDAEAELHSGEGELISSSFLELQSNHTLEFDVESISDEELAEFEKHFASLLEMGGDDGDIMHHLLHHEADGDFSDGDLVVKKFIKKIFDYTKKHAKIIFFHQNFVQNFNFSSFEIPKIWF